MTVHAKDTLRGPGVTEIFNPPLAIPAFKAVGAKGLVAGQDGQVFDLVSARAAAVCTVAADQRAIAQEEQMRIRVEQGVTGVTSEAIDMPSVAGWEIQNQQGGRNKEPIPTYLIQKPFPPRESVKNKDPVSRGTMAADPENKNILLHSPCKGTRCLPGPLGTRG